MSVNKSANHPQGTVDVTGGVSRVRLLMRAVAVLVLPAVILFASSGRLDWGMGWVYVVVTTALTILSRVIIWRTNPDLIAERAQSLDREDTKSWDKVLMPLVAIFGPLVMLLVAGLDMRFGWSPQIPLALQIAALVVILLGYVIGIWATAVNRFFSAVVRIQKERGHTVVTSGPYQYIRHPGYAGGIAADLAIAIMLGSLWALIPAGIIVGLLVIRTALEDKILQAELEGYQAYAQQVRYRLLPGVW